MPALVYILLSIALAVFAPWRPEPIVSYRDGAEPLRCKPPLQLTRTFVGFPEGQGNLRDFEPAAAEAARILQVVEQQSCALGELQDGGGRLHTALSTSRLVIDRLIFRSSELNDAEMHLRSSDDAKNAARRPELSNWTLRIARDDGDTWQVVSSLQR